MSTSTHRWFFLGAALSVVSVAHPVCGQSVLMVDIKTVASRGSGLNDSPVQPRLFLDAEAKVAAPLGTSLWFIIDLNGDGLAVQKLGRTEVLPTEILGVDDFVVLRDAVNGDQPGVRPGQFRRNGAAVDLPAGTSVDAVLQGNVFALLWNGPESGAQPEPGSSFGVQDLGVNPKPPVGNPFWAISEDLTATTFTVTPVPEPAAVAGVALALAAWAGWRTTRAGRTDRQP